MRYTLIVKSGRNGISLCCKCEDIVVAYMSQVQADFAVVLTTFLDRFSLVPCQIEKVILVSDLSRFIYHTQSDPGLLYIRVFPQGARPPEFNSNTVQDGKMIPWFDIPFDKDDTPLELVPLFKYLDKYKACKIAINSIFSSVSIQREEVLANILRERYGDHCIIRTAHQLYIHNVQLRENMLLLNTMLYDNVKNYIDQILNRLRECGITANLFVLKGDGTLYNSRLAVLYPMETWQVDTACLMMDLAFGTHTADAFIIFKDSKNGWVGMVRNEIPLVSHNPTLYRNCHIMGSFPLLMPISRHCTETEILEILRQMNKLNGPVQILLYGPSTPQLPKFFEYPHRKVEPDCIICGSGADRAVYRREISKYVISRSAQDISVTKQELLNTALAELDADGIPTGSAEYSFTRVPIKYMLDDICIMKIVVTIKV